MRTETTALGMLLAGWISAAPAAAAKYHWYNYTIDSATVEGYNQVHFDAKGVAKIVYRYTHFIRLAEFDGKSFKVHFADSLMTSGQKLAMELDPDGNPHIIREDHKDSRIMYAHFDGTQWTRYNLDTTANQGQDFYQVALKIDSKSKLHAIYTEGRNNHHELSYTTLDKAGVRSEPAHVLDSTASGKWNSLVLDAEERPVAAYFRHQENRLLVGWPEDGAWKHEIVKVDSTYMPEGFYSQIVRRNSDYLVSFHDRTRRHLQVVTGAPKGAWKLEKVDSLTGWTQMSTPSPMVLGKGGEPIIAYAQAISTGEMTVSSARLHLAYREGDVWKNELVDSSSPIVGLFASLTLTPDSLPAIAYYDQSKTALRLAIASLTPPPDEDANGIPDYKEKSLPRTSIKVRVRQAVLGAVPAGSAWYDAKGRKVLAETGAPKAGAGSAPAPKRAPGVYFGKPGAEKR